MKDDIHEILDSKMIEIHNGSEEGKVVFHLQSSRDEKREQKPRECGGGEGDEGGTSLVFCLGGGENRRIEESLGVF